MRTRTRLSAMMFLQFFVWGAWYVSMTGFITKSGMAGLTGAAYAVGPLAAIIAPFFLGMIADRFFSTERVLGVLHLLGRRIFDRCAVRRAAIRVAACAARIRACSINSCCTICRLTKSRSRCCCSPTCSATCRRWG